MRPIAIRPAWLALLSLLLLSMPLEAQEKKTLTPEDYGQWESLGMGTLSPDGSWIAYGVGFVEGDGELRLREIATESERRVPLAVNPAFSSDSRWVAYTLTLTEKERERRRKGRQPVRNKVGILDLEGDEEVVIDDVASFRFSAKGPYLAVRGYPAEGGKTRGADLVVIDLESGLKTTFGNVTEFAWQDEGTLLAMTLAAGVREGNGVMVYDPGSGTLRTLASDTTTFRSLAWRKEADDLAVLQTKTDSLFEGESHQILAWRGLSGRRTTTTTYDHQADPSFPAEMRIVEHRPLRWAEHGRSLFFGIKEWERKGEDEASDSTRRVAASDSTDQVPERSDTEEPANVEVWHSADVDIIPEQKVRLPRTRNENYLAVWHLDSRDFIQLADSMISVVTIAEGDEIALGGDDLSYERERMFGPIYRDQYLIDLRTGNREKIAEKIQFSYGISPGNRYYLYLLDDHYWTYDLRTGNRVNITAEIPTTFVNHENDHTVEQKPPFGIAGWTKGDKSLILYDKYDLWEVRPDGSRPRRLTNGAEDEVRYRYVRLDPDESAIDPSRPLYLATYGEWTKEMGYARLRVGREPEELLRRDRSVGRLTKAKDAEVYAYVIQGFDESPNYYVGGPALRDAKRVSDTNPFQSEYAWGHSELIDFTNARGERLQGALYYPANYEPGKKYPMIVYIYEIRSNTIHSYSVPSERSPYNPTVFTSQGYFFFQPDITYRDRNPGLSAVESIVPAVEKVLETGMIDQEKVGLVGHSWGAYQTAFTITQTDLFSAAVAGAPLTNLISMSLQVYWNTGGTNARIFEISQGRMEVPFWRDLEAYQVNSPVFHIEKMDTPLLVAFGDEDGAVDWSQGVELYNAARRAGKEMVLLVYPGENHSLRQKPNQIDYHRRIVDWFGHYLLGEPAPRWITHGVSVLEREKELKALEKQR